MQSRRANFLGNEKSGEPTSNMDKISINMVDLLEQQRWNARQAKNPPTNVTNRQVAVRNITAYVAM